MSDGSVAGVEAERTLASWVDGGATPSTEDMRVALGTLIGSNPTRLIELLELALSQKASNASVSVAELHAAIALAQQRMGSIDASAAHIEAALRDYPESSHLLGLLAAVRAVENRPREAADAAQRAIDAGMGDDADVLMILGTSLIQTRRAVEAIPVLQRVRSLNPSQPGLRFRLLWSHIMKWQVPIKLTVFVCALWALVDASTVGSIMTAVAVVPTSILAVVAAQGRHVRTAIFLGFLAAAVLAGHVFLAPTALG